MRRTPPGGPSAPHGVAPHSRGLAKANHGVPRSPLSCGRQVPRLTVLPGLPPGSIRGCVEPTRTFLCCHSARFHSELRILMTTPLSQGVGSKVQVLGFREGGSSLLGLQMRSGRETLAGPLYTNRRYPAVKLGAGTVPLSRLRPRHQLVVKSCRGPRLAAPALSEHPSASTRSHGARSTCCGSRKNDG